MGPTELRTPRLLLRQWRDEDLEPFAALNADPRVMECFPSPLDRAASDALAARARARIEQDGWGLWAVEVVGSVPFAGFVGLLAAVGLPPSPAVEVGWRLAADTWGRGYATEAALAAVQHGFDVLGLDEVVSFTTVRNMRSRRVMQKTGLVHEPARDFDHPRTPGWWGQRHVLYAARSGTWSRPVAT